MGGGVEWGHMFVVLRGDFFYFIYKLTIVENNTRGRCAKENCFLYAYVLMGVKINKNSVLLISKLSYLFYNGMK